MRFASIVFIALSAAFLNFVPSQAASVTFIGINSVSVDCPSTTITINLKLQVSANVADYNFGGTNYDLFELVLYDGAGTAFAYKATLTSVGANGTYNILYSIFMNLPTYRPFTVKLFDLTAFPADLTQAQAGPLLDSLTFDPNAFVISPCTDLPIFPSATASGDNVLRPAFRDGRINNWDAGSPVVVYGHEYETGRGLVVYSPSGVLLMQVHPEQIGAVEACPNANTLIAHTDHIALYRLRGCLFQINARTLDGTKNYIMIFKDLYENTGYRSYEE